MNKGNQFLTSGGLHFCENDIKVAKDNNYILKSTYKKYKDASYLLFSLLSQCPQE